jgi:TRAP-type C4-dicarboxylate transport system permease large subunit
MITTSAGGSSRRSCCRTALEGFSMIATTLPVVLPLVTAAGFDKVWFGIFVVFVIEIAQITPPVAFNLSVITITSTTSATASKIV